MALFGMSTCRPPELFARNRDLTLGRPVGAKLGGLAGGESSSYAYLSLSSASLRWRSASAGAQSADCPSSPSSGSRPVSDGLQWTANSPGSFCQHQRTSKVVGEGRLVEHHGLHLLLGGQRFGFHMQKSHLQPPNGGGCSFVVSALHVGRCLPRLRSILTASCAGCRSSRW